MPQTPEQRSAQLARARAMRGQSKNTETPAASNPSPGADRQPAVEIVNPETPAAGMAAESAPVRAEPQPVARETDHETLQEPPGDHDKPALGRLAEALTGNPAVKDAFRRAVVETVKAWENSPAGDPQMREFLYHDLRAIRALEQQLGRIAQEGRVDTIKRDRLKVMR